MHDASQYEILGPSDASRRAARLNATVPLEVSREKIAPRRRHGSHPMTMTRGRRVRVQELLSGRDRNVSTAEMDSRSGPCVTIEILVSYTSTISAPRPIAREAAGIILAQEVERGLRSLREAGPTAIRRRSAPQKARHRR